MISVSNVSHATNYSSGRIDLVKHKINDHTGDAHIQPNRQGNSRDSPVPDKVSAKRAIESQGDERHDHDRQDRVTCENCEVERSDEAGALKTCRAVVKVISEIRRQKQDRNHERGYLARAVSNYISISYESVSSEQQQRARAVETSV